MSQWVYLAEQRSKELSTHSCGFHESGKWIFQICSLQGLPEFCTCKWTFIRLCSHGIIHQLVQTHYSLIRCLNASCNVLVIMSVHRANVLSDLWIKPKCFRVLTNRANLVFRSGVGWVRWVATLSGLGGRILRIFSYTLKFFSCWQGEVGCQLRSSLVGNTWKNLYKCLHAQLGTPQTNTRTHIRHRHNTHNTKPSQKTDALRSWKWASRISYVKYDIIV
jgi:hypothetical protein